MAYMQTTTTIAPTSSAILNYVEAAMTKWRERQLARTTFNALSRLSDHDLADIGLTRSELRDVSRKSSGNFR